MSKDYSYNEAKLKSRQGRAIYGLLGQQLGGLGAVVAGGTKGNILGRYAAGSVVGAGAGYLAGGHLPVGGNRQLDYTVERAIKHYKKTGKKNAVFRDLEKNYDLKLSKQAALKNFFMVKEAVSIQDLRRAYTKLVKPRVIRMSRGDFKFERRQQALLKEMGYGRIADMMRANEVPFAAIPKSALTPSKQQLEFSMGQMYGSLPRQKQEELVNRAYRSVVRIRPKVDSIKGDHVISMSGDPVKKLRGLGVDTSDLASPQAKELYNRTIGLHEATEVQSVNRAIRKAKRQGETFDQRPTLFSHHGTDPIVNDMNIANTLTGPGSAEAKRAFHKMRASEFKQLRLKLRHDPKAVELIDTLTSGGRINRHGRRYLRNAYSRHHAASAKKMNALKGVSR